MIDLKELIIKGAEANDEGRFDPKFRAQYMNASEAMTCIRKQWYQKFKPETAAPQNWGYARRGNHAEKYVVYSLNASGRYMVDHTGEDQLSLQDNERRLSVTPDGVLISRHGDARCQGIEIKTIDPRTNTTRLPKAEHVAQLQIAMAMLNDQGYYTLDSGILVYMNASDFDDIYQFEVQHDPTILSKMAKRAKRLFRAKTADILDREGKRNGGQECKSRCAFTEICGVGGAAEEEEKSAGPSNLQGLTERYLNLKQEEESAKAKRDSVAEDIKRLMKQYKLDTTTVAGASLEYKQVKGRQTLDKKALSAVIDLSPYIKVGKASERLTIKPI